MCYDDTIVQVREEELRELDELLSDVCELPVAGGCENSYGKVNILLQSFISRHRVDCFSLVSDQAYVAQVSLSVDLRHRMDRLLLARVRLGVRRAGEVQRTASTAFHSEFGRKRVEFRHVQVAV